MNELLGFSWVVRLLDFISLFFLGGGWVFLFFDGDFFVGGVVYRLFGKGIR